jgi:6-pyruvoyltetrahydropterin/6-carboxytetrahydropterin synthase
MKTTIEILKRFDFEAAHNLPKYHGKCQNLHGHSYELIVGIKSQTDQSGISVDTTKIKQIVNEKIIDRLDHSHLNRLLENPTMENIVMWIFNQLKTDLPISSIKISETRNNSAVLTCEIK